MARLASRERVGYIAVAVGAALGLLAAFVLSVETLTLAKNPDANLICNFNVFFNCASVAKTDAAELFGFPNSFIGMMTLPVLVTVGVAGAAGVRFPRWFMRAAGIAGVAGLVFAGWMFYESYVVIGALCPWCLLTDFGMIVASFGLYRVLAISGYLGGAKSTVTAIVARDYDMMIAIGLVVLMTASIVAKYGSGF